MTIKKAVNMYIDSMSNDSMVTPRIICGCVEAGTGRFPFDSTVTRYLRQRNAERGDIVCCDRVRSIYRKIK